jgi:hypothetical protein
MNELRLSKIQPDGDHDVILKAFLNNELDLLPEALQKRFKRWETIHELVKEGRILQKHKIVKFLMARFPGEVGRAQAHNDIDESQAFFGTVQHRDQKEYKRGLYVEWLEQWAHKAAKNGDYSTAEKMLKTAGSFMGLDDHSPEAPDMSEIIIWQPVFVYDPSIIMGDRPLPDVNKLRIKYLNKKEKKKFEEDMANG